MQLNSDMLHTMKYRLPGETFAQWCQRLTEASGSPEIEPLLRSQAILPGGRVSAALGSPLALTCMSCFVMPQIEDSTEGIMDIAHRAMQTVRAGGGVGYDFSTLRPAGTNVQSLDCEAAGPVAFMPIYDAMCGAIKSSGHRRGAQMGMLKVSHPDIFEFIRAKRDNHSLTNFNISVAVSDAFMDAVERDAPWPLIWNGIPYREVRAKELWDEIMVSTWDYAEPGVIFIDTVNRNNNLRYAERIFATNPCSEQPLPPNGACLLGSLNLTKFVNGGRFEWSLFDLAVGKAVTFLDKVIDVSSYPLPEQAEEMRLKRRIGLGVTGLANVVEHLAGPYGSPEAVALTDEIMARLTFSAYRASALRARECGSFPLFDAERYEARVKLPPEIRELVRGGIRNSHLISIAPTGTISLCADNVSSGIEPTFAEHLRRPINTFSGPIMTDWVDYGVQNWGLRPRTADKCSVADHLAMLKACIPYVDSSISKTVNVPSTTSFGEFEDIYKEAWKMGAKGLSTFRIDGKRFAQLERKSEACYIDPETGDRSCES